MKYRAITATLVTTAAVIGSATSAQATTPVMSGTGWKLINTYIGASPWKIQFYDSNSRDKMKGYAKLTAAHLTTHTGVTFEVTDTINRFEGTCPSKYTIVMRLEWDVDRSWGRPCSINGMSASGFAMFSYKNWIYKTLSGSHSIYRRKVTSHELMHTVGLAHPNVTGWTSSTYPLMRGGTWGGYWSLYSSDNPTKWDIAGLKRLVYNRP